MLQAVFNAFKIPDLRRRIIFTVLMLLVFRVVAHIPVPGVDLAKLDQLLKQNQLLGMLNLFSGSALRQFSVAAMGVYPYITATIIFQLLGPIIPRLEELGKEGEQGRATLNRYQHIATVPLALLQAFGQCQLMKSQGVLSGFGLFDGSTALRSIAILASMTAGSMFLVWLGELITENGIGQGVSIIIFGGIVANLPASVGNLATGNSVTQNIAGTVIFLVLGLITIVGIVLINEGQRRIQVNYARRVRGNRMYGGQTTHIPLKVNSAGMIPLIFAVSIMVFPGYIANLFTASDRAWLREPANFLAKVFDANSLQYQIIYFFMVVGFTYFYTVVVFQQQNIAENLQKNGGFIPGIRPGTPTNIYLMKVLTRITLVGAIFLGVVAVMPWIAAKMTGVQTLFLSSTSLLIVVGVAIDTMRQLEAQLLMRHYEGFIK
ncbi:MAG: preprotein translocase subunit SecY [Thermomicrobiales bacterium]|jgi:preprotein translocase subunit SecY|nr:preprotein translocase subunit SecY [Thermomicrobiales bacterium]